MLELTIQKREERGTNSVKALRRNGAMPAVLYGRKEESMPITVSRDDFQKIFKEAGESSIINLVGVGDAKEALIHEVDIHPLTGEPRHADFYIIEKGKKVTVHVPLEFEGVAPAVKELGGTLVKVLHELEIEAMPKDLPHEIMANISSLVDFESRLLAKDVKLPEGVELITNPEDTVALVSEVTEEVEEEPVMNMEDIEVEQKGKKEESSDAADSSQGTS